MVQAAAFAVIATGASQREVVDVVGAAMVAGDDVLDGGSAQGLAVRADQDQGVAVDAFAAPSSLPTQIDRVEGRVGGDDGQDALAAARAHGRWCRRVGAH